MRRIIGFFIKLAVAALCFVGITVLLIVLDGLNDVGDSADAALVVGHDDGTPDIAGLERAAKLYKDGEFHQIIVSSASEYPSFDAQAAMTKFLEEHHVPSSSIIEDSGAKDTGEMAHDVAELMKDRNLTSVMIICDYYRMTRIKLALLHAGVGGIAKSHVGEAGIGDAWPVAREVGALYSYFYHTFIAPTAEKVKQEAATEADKASKEAQKARDSVNNQLDKLPK
jgi:uncharacterized SAM-binding protein YcdF (DUF218 family)